MLDEFSASGPHVLRAAGPPTLARFHGAIPFVQHHELNPRLGSVPVPRRVGAPAPGFDLAPHMLGTKPQRTTDRECIRSELRLVIAISSMPRQRACSHVCEKARLSYRLNLHQFELTMIIILGASENMKTP
jgi:hypothetical protein